MDIDVAQGQIDDASTSLFSLHERISAGDRTAGSRLAFDHYETLVQRTRAGFDVHDPHLVYEAVNDALLGYIHHPDRYKPEKSPLLNYLVMSARGDLRNALEREQKRAARERPLVGRVEDDRDEPEQEMEIAAPDDVEAEVLAMFSEVPGILDGLFPDAGDRRMVDMMLEKIRETSEYSALLGLGHLSDQEQADEIKRRKDRIKKKLQRWAESGRGGLHDD